MPEPRHPHLRRLFDRALEVPATARTAWLDSECGDDAKLKQRLLAMLAAAADEHFLPAPTGLQPRSAAAPDDAAAALAEGPGAHIGPYKLLQQIGEGGFGVVFMAEQEKPVARRVALKIIKLGMDTRQVVARFEQERQALAMMDHPHIARVLDAGATAAGRPYFVMDLVKGAPIVEYCDKNHLSIDERLELFAQVCGAVQHAHGKGIIHRDIKPSNILVGTQDGQHQAKVIDFGIAKATSSKLTDKTLFTEHQQVIGTLQYMSPEQAEGSLDIDTRTDVYSLGVLLYELLTGSTPFDKKTIHGAMYGELQRMIREVEPPRPSTRLDQSRDTLASIAAHRRTEPKRLSSLIRGELDWIVMKALEKDRARRYETANGLAMDIKRHLAGDAVVAAPPSGSYRLRKFVRRNKGTVAAAAAVTAALLIGVVGFAWQAAVAGDERDKAVRAKIAETEQRQAADEQRALAEAQKAEAKARADELKMVADFQAGMLAQIDPTTAGLDLTADVTARFATALAKKLPPAAASEQAAQVESFTKLWQRVNATDAARELIDRTILKPAVAAIDTQFEAQPLVAAQLQQTLAARYQQVGLYDAALPLQQQALATRRRVLGEEHVDTLLSTAQMGSLLKAQGQFAKAESCLREVLAKRRRVLGEEHPDTLGAMENLGELLWEASQTSEAEPLLREALAKHRRVLGEEHPETLIAVNNLGLVLSGQDKFAEAEPYYRESLDKSRRVLGEDHPNTVISINNMGWLLQAQGRFADAEPFLVEALAKRRRLQGLQHPLTLNSINNVGMLLHKQGKLGEAEPLLREALALRRRVLGEDHPDTLISLLNLGFLLRDEGQVAEAGTLLSASVAGNRRLRGDDHPSTLVAIVAFGTLLAEQGLHADAVALLAPSEAAARKEFQGSSSVRRFGALLTNLGTSRARLATNAADFAVAAANLLEAQPILERTRGQKHKQTIACIQALVDLYAAWDKVEPGKGHDGESAAWRVTLAASK